MSRKPIEVLTEGALGAASALWPKICCDAAEFGKHAETVGASHEQVERFGTDLVLAFACARSDPEGLRVFESEHVSRIGPSLLRVDPSADFLDEVQQRLRERLLVPPNPRIRSYAATGPLLSWVRVAATRIGVDLKRHEPKRGTQNLADCMLQECHLQGPEAVRYRDVLEASIRSVFGQLEVRERNLIRLHYVDGLNVDRLGAMYDVHRATAARWIAAVRTRIFEDVACDVRATLKLSRSEFYSILGFVRSYLEASLGGLLGPAPVTAEREGPP